MANELDEIRRRSEVMARSQRTSGRPTPVHTGPMTERTPAERKRLALGLVERGAEAALAAERDLENAMLFAQDEGASLREIGEAAGIPHTRVSRMIERRRSS